MPVNVLDVPYVGDFAGAHSTADALRLEEERRDMYRASVTSAGAIYNNSSIDIYDRNGALAFHAGPDGTNIAGNLSIGAGLIAPQALANQMALSTAKSITWVKGGVVFKYGVPYMFNDTTIIPPAWAQSALILFNSVDVVLSVDNALGLNDPGLLGMRFGVAYNPAIDKSVGDLIRGDLDWTATSYADAHQFQSQYREGVAISASGAMAIDLTDRSTSGFRGGSNDGVRLMQAIEPGENTPDLTNSFDIAVTMQLSIYYMHAPLKSQRALHGL